MFFNNVGLNFRKNILNKPFLKFVLPEAIIWFGNRFTLEIENRVYDTDCKFEYLKVADSTKQQR